MRRLSVFALVWAVVTAAGGVVAAVAAVPVTDPAVVERLVDAAPVLPGREPSGTAHPAGSPTAPTAAVGRATSANAPFRPQRLVLPDGRSAPVTSSGLHADGSLVIPDDPAVVGWWTGGAFAGDAYGSVVLAGHVDSARYGLGVMAALERLQVGQVVQVRAGSRVQRYRVSSRREVPQAELAARTDAFRQDVAHRLVLITCGGAFDRARHRYQDNVLVYADPLPATATG